MAFLNDSGTNKEILTNLTKRVYYLTLLFPKKEPLRYKMREMADNILSDYIFVDYLIRNRNDYFGSNPENKLKTVETKISQLYASFSVIDAFFDIAISQNWVKESELLEAKKEYAKVAEVIKKEWEKRENSLQDRNVLIEKENRQTEEMEKSNLSLATVNLLSERTEDERAVGQTFIGKKRQEVIISFLEEHGKAQVWQIKKLFPKITKRTIRRDFDALVKQGIVKRIGQRNETFYQLSS